MFPVELITLVVSLVVSAIIKLVASKMKMDAARWEMALRRHQVVEEGREAARKWQGRHFQWARRFIVISAMSALFLAPTFLALFRPDVPVSYGYWQDGRGFWFLWESISQARFVELRGLVILPFHTHTLAAIMGFYFGGRLGE